MRVHIPLFMSFISSNSVTVKAFSRWFYEMFICICVKRTRRLGSNAKKQTQRLPAVILCRGWLGDSFANISCYKCFHYFRESLDCQLVLINASEAINIKFNVIYKGCPKIIGKPNYILKGWIYKCYISTKPIILLFVIVFMIDKNVSSHFEMKVYLNSFK